MMQKPTNATGCARAAVQTEVVQTFFVLFKAKFLKQTRFNIFFRKTISFPVFCQWAHCSCVALFNIGLFNMLYVRAHLGYFRYDFWAVQYQLHLLSLYNRVVRKAQVFAPNSA
jgi:hypothetical protein